MRRETRQGPLSDIEPAALCPAQLKAGPPDPVGAFMNAARNILCLSSYFKGNRFFHCCRQGGGSRLAHYYRVHSAMRPAARLPGRRVSHAVDSIDRRAVVNGVAYLLRSRPIDSIVALDEFDAEIAAFLREHFRLPGMGESTVRYFRDKLAMRVKASRRRDCPSRTLPASSTTTKVRRFLPASAPPPLVVEAPQRGVVHRHSEIP